MHFCFRFNLLFTFLVFTFDSFFLHNNILCSKIEYPLLSWNKFLLVSYLAFLALKSFILKLWILPCSLLLFFDFGFVFFFVTDFCFLFTFTRWWVVLLSEIFIPDFFTYFQKFILLSIHHFQLFLYASNFW